MGFWGAGADVSSSSDAVGSSGGNNFQCGLLIAAANCAGGWIFHKDLYARVRSNKLGVSSTPSRHDCKRRRDCCKEAPYRQVMTKS